METEKITVRLPVHLVRAIDTFVKMGEFGSRSEAIRRAIKMLVDDMMHDIEERAEMWRKLQELEAMTEEINKMKKK